ncbi:MAG: YraN family protein [Omnitrophica WOR_2 bacterium GWA2_47_8]|nr:MAG: YraN family protein [Omnitrophica WOR_2 bacterium GWA2_47_8]
MPNISFGQKGESLAEDFLKRHGYRILIRNFKVKLGEIDLIGYDRDTLCFIEVKTRRSAFQGSPFEAISKHKRRKLAQVAFCYLKKQNLFGCKARFDVVGILQEEGKEPAIDFIKNAFSLDDLQ